MESSEIRGEELVTVWMERSVGNRETFGYLILEFLNQRPEIAAQGDAETVLRIALHKAGIIVQEYPDDVALNLSYKAFSSALEHFINAL